VIHQLENARTREQMLDAINTFRAWLEAEDLLFPTDFANGIKIDDDAA
jgi:hypothetical protein